MSGVIVRGALRVVGDCDCDRGVIDPALSRSVIPESPVVAIHMTAADPSAIDRALRDQIDGRELLVREAASIACRVARMRIAS